MLTQVAIPGSGWRPLFLGRILCRFICTSAKIAIPITSSCRDFPILHLRNAHLAVAGFTNNSRRKSASTSKAVVSISLTIRRAPAPTTPQRGKPTKRKRPPQNLTKLWLEFFSRLLSVTHDAVCATITPRAFLCGTFASLRLCVSVVSFLQRSISLQPWHWSPLQSPNNPIPNDGACFSSCQISAVGKTL